MACRAAARPTLAMRRSLSRQPPIVLTWPPMKGAASYRVILRDSTTDTVVLKRVVDGFSMPIEPRKLHGDHRYEWRVQAMSSRFGEWEDLLPYLRVLPPRPAGADVLHLRWPATEEPSRLLLRDQTAERTVLKDGILGNVYPLERSILASDHEYAYAVQTFRDGEWTTTQDYRRVPRARGAKVAAERRPRRHGDDPAPQLFLWTCDTEVNMRFMRDPVPARGVDQQVFGRVGEESYGVGLMMDMLERAGLRGTFFLDILMEHQFGRSEVERIIEAIDGRGHDLQLHLHPSPNLLLSGDPELAKLAPALTADDPDLFRRALALAADLFERRVGRPAVAFRSGAYHLCDAYLSVLPEFGIQVDSSLNPFKNCRVSEWMQARTQPFFVTPELLEIPVGWLLYDNSAGRHHQQLSPVMSGRQQDALAHFEPLAPGPPATVVYLAHSFSLLSMTRGQDDEHVRRWNAAYARQCAPAVGHTLRMGEGGEVILLDPSPEQDRIDLMARLLHGVAGREDVRGCTFRELVADGLDRWRGPRSSPVDPLAVWHGPANDASVTGTRVYSSAYLGELERRAAQEA